MECLTNFKGWTDPDEEAQKNIRVLVSKLNLRPLAEPGDIDSPLLRSQIDEQYLIAMARSREQMTGSGMEERRTPRQASGSRRGSSHSSSKKGSMEGTLRPMSVSNARTQGPIVCSRNLANHHICFVQGHPPVCPHQMPSPAHGMPPHIGSASPAGVRRPHWGQHNTAQWWPNGWTPHGGAFPYGDDASVHSALSGDTSFSHHYDLGSFHGALHHPSFYPPMMYPQHHMPAGHSQMPYDPSMADPSALYRHHHDNFNADASALGMMGSHRMGQIPPHNADPAHLMPGTPGGPPAGHEAAAFINSPSSHLPTDQQFSTPYKYNPNQVPMSPYWGHLDQATLAMMGIATPQGPAAPQTPARRADLQGAGDAKLDGVAASMNAQPLLLRQQYYGYGVSLTRWW